MKWILPCLALAFCYLVFGAYLFSSYEGLPARVATHFDIMGRPNGWMSRDGLIEFMLGFGILTPAFVVGSMAGVGYIPVSFVNLPNRDYWLAPERRRATSAILLRFALWLACILVLLFTGLYGLVIQANSPGYGRHLNGLGISLLLGGFLVGTLIWSLMLRRRFRLAP
jgi:uncharacterized membrane protein